MLGAGAPATSTDTAKTDKRPRKEIGPGGPSTIPQAAGGGAARCGEYFEQGLPQGSDPWYGKTKHGQYMTEADATRLATSKPKRRDGQEGRDEEDEMKK